MIMTDQHRADWLGCNGHPDVWLLGHVWLTFRLSPALQQGRARHQYGRYLVQHGFYIFQVRTLLTPERFSVFRSMKDTKNDTGLYA